MLTLQILKLAINKKNLADVIAWFLFIVVYERADNGIIYMKPNKYNPLIWIVCIISLIYNIPMGGWNHAIFVLKTGFIPVKTDYYIE